MYRVPWVYDPQGTEAPTLTLSLAPRGCTDIICCVFLLLAIVGYVAVGIIGEWRRERDSGFWGEREATASGSGVGLMLRRGRQCLSVSGFLHSLDPWRPSKGDLPH